MPTDPDYSPAAIEQLVGWYTAAARRLEAIVLHPPGRTEASREFRVAQAAVLHDQIRAIIQDVKQKLTGRQIRRDGRRITVPGWIGRHIPRAYKEGQVYADKQLSRLGIDFRTDIANPGDFSRIDRRAIEVLAQDATGDLFKAADAMGKRATSLLRHTAQQGLGEAQINRILAHGVVEGIPLQTIRDLRKELEAVHGHTVTIIDKNGDPREFQAGYYAEMVVRTKTRQTMVIARHQRLQDQGLDLVRIVGKVSDNFCSAFLGQVFSLSGHSSKYPPYDSLPGGGPPFHPNCTKGTTPFIEELATDEQVELAQGPPSGDSRKLLGMTGSEAQHAFRDLQLRQQVEPVYSGKARKAG